MTLTTIPLQKETLVRLKKYKIVKKESYDEEINRILDDIDKQKSDSYNSQ